MELRGRTVLVTGGSGGIGTAGCRAFAAEGCHVALTFLKGEAAARALVSEISARGRKARAYPLDVTDRAAVADLPAKLARDFGGLDVLVNNAGILDFSTFDEMTPDLWYRTIEVNLTGVYNVTRALLSMLLAAKGRIINVASIAGQMGGRAGAHYAASKAGLIGLTRSLALELGPRGVLVNAVAPEVVDTGLVSADRQAELAKLNVLGKALTAAEVAETIVSLARSDHVTGQTLSLNAARWMP